MNLSNELESYILSHIEDEDPILAKLYRETHVKQLYARMCSGHIQGSLLTLISKLVAPRYILELGTFTGYSAICLSKGLSHSGILHTVEINDELEDFARSYFVEAGVDNMIVQHVGDVVDIIPKLDEAFDLVFLDADKRRYIDHYNLVFPKIRKGGVIIADNTLWDGKVLFEDAGIDEQTRGIKEFNDLVKTDTRVETFMLPIRDGLTVLRKI
jgi:predicted O-methyltransferase YrrM